MRQSFSAMVLGDFNAKNKLWFAQDNTSYESSSLNDLMAQYGLTQIIHKPKYILESSVSCIDLAFTSQENLVIISGVYSSLESHLHIVFSNFKLKSIIHLHMNV